MSQPASVEQSTETLVRRGRAARTGWLILGFVLVGIGILGIVVPLLPTTDFMLLALPCFARSSPRLEAWLLNHPRFGPSLRAWRAEGAVPRHAKMAACIGMALGYGLFWFHVRPSLVTSLLVAAAMGACAAWVLSRPAPGRER